MLSERAMQIKPSPTLEIDAMAKAMKKEGRDIISFGVGEPDFDTPENIKEAAIKAIRDGFTKYTPVGGIDELKEAIVEKFKRDNSITYKKSEILVSCGAKHSLYNIAQSLINDGDEVIIPVPYWVSYPDQVLLNGGIPVFLRTKEEDSFMMMPHDLRKAITPRTKAVIINSPSNPTGQIYTEDVLMEIAEIIVEKNLYVISDEIYEKLLYDGARHISTASLNDEIKKRTIVVNGLSKSHAMTGWRIGYAAGPEDIIKAMTDIQSQSTSNPTSISQKAAIEALMGPQDFTEIMRKEFDKRRRFIVDELNSIEGITCSMPKGAFYVFPRVSSLYGRGDGSRKIMNSQDLSMYLLEKAGVAVVPGIAFGDDNYIRLSYATSMVNIKKGMERIKEAILRLR